MLKETFQTKNLRQLCYSMSIKIIHIKKSIILFQRKYGQDLLTKVYTLGCMMLDIHMNRNS